jgi:hypothetical protein
LKIKFLKKDYVGEENYILKKINAFKLPAYYLIMANKGRFGPPLGSQLGKDMRNHRNYINTLEKGAGSHIIHFHLPREVRQFEDTQQALREGFVPCHDPRGWSIGLSKMKPLGLDAQRNTVQGYEADLILDCIDIPDDVEGYVASVTEWEDDSVNNHFNISAQYYKKRGK